MRIKSKLFIIKKKFVSVSNNPNSPSKEYTTSISYFGILMDMEEKNVVNS